MLKTNQLIVLGVIVLVVGFILLNRREHLSNNKDNSKNWDKPELTTSPMPTPEGQDIDNMKSRIKSLEVDVAALKSKVSK
jgi:hypothetical protein